MTPDRYEFESRKISRGKRAVVSLPVARFPTGGEVTLDVAVVHGHQPGPTIWLSGAVHGDELNGVEIVRRVLDSVKAKELSGTILAVPIVNVFGVLNKSRYLPDRRDLNRSFPGSVRGSAASRLARLMLTKIVARSDVGIDFHTAATHRTNLPQIRADLDDPQTMNLARVFGADAIVHARIRDGSLRQAATERGIPTLVFEGGEPDRFEDAIVAGAVDGTLRVMGSIGMLEGIKMTRRRTYVVRNAYWVRARRGGFLRLTVDVGAKVVEDQKIGEIGDTLGKPVSVKAPHDGVVLGRTLNPVIHKGDAVVNIGSKGSTKRSG